MIPDNIKEFLTKHLNGLRQSMCLTHFKIDMVFANLKGQSMCIEVDYRYLDAQIDIDRKEIIDLWHYGRKRRILETLSHEIVHIITGELTEPRHCKSKEYKKLKKWQQHYEERVTEHVSRLALELYLLENKIKL